MTLTSKTSCYKSKFITAELASLFSQSGDEEEFKGFSDDEEKEVEVEEASNDKTVESEDSDMDTGFYSDDEAAPPRRSLCVALKFPSKRVPTPKQELPEKEKKEVKVKMNAKKKELVAGAATPLRRTSARKKLKEVVVKAEKKNEVVLVVAAAAPPPLRRGARERKKQEEAVKEEEEEKKVEEGGEEEALCLSLRKRDKNIMENKAMLAQLFADLSTMAELTSHNTPQKRKSSVGEKPSPRKRRPELQAGSERRNPSRKARPPEHFGVEEKPVSPGGGGRGPRMVDIRRLVEVDEDGVKRVKKRRVSQGSKRGQYVVCSVDQITKEDLDNIAYRAKDKIWDKDHGSSCHQCRQKTLDTKTMCRSGYCVGGKGQFCGPCLKNRYGEDVREVLLDPTWSCPLCRGVCNCSLCRKREGRCATGILVGLARYNGHDNVHQYLQR
ncbi:Cell division cycle-associated 7-like protein [Merluccius polli]|uniref:Cell division cycle-associated 7-like protein n=1 Tax=Merluccius polli TaxID=89951 RepID=A0AA47MXJ0_MERPO|nr:Cell division cycle-associated 7-like protein [Merluccius polli]